MRLFKSLAIAIFLVLLNLSPVWAQEEASGKDVSVKAVVMSETMGWTPQVLLSSYVGENRSEGYVDLLIPLLQNDDGMVFLYPRFGLSSDVDPGYSMGLGIRQYIPELDIVLGGNLFYDRYASPNDNYYNQLGLGAEVLTRWVDARFNYYIPDSNPNVIDGQNVESVSRTQSRSSSWGQAFGSGYTIQQPYTSTTTTRTTTVNQLFERFEDTMQGFDAEVGVLTPWLEQYVALRWFAGYYNFNNSFGGDIKGMKGRAELRFSSKLAIDATYYEDEEVAGNNWVFGVRMSIPVFMENLADGRSPFQGSFSGIFDGVNMGNRKRESTILRGGVGSTYPSGYAALSPFAAMAPARSFSAATRSGRSSSVRDRMTEIVLRQAGARTSESGFIENLAARDVSVATEIDRVTRIVVIEDSIVFVSNVRGLGTNSGTFENPLNTIQGGVNRASVLFANRGDVFVAGTGVNYVEDVVDANSSVKVWGGARGIPVNGGRRFTYGSQPVLDGGFQVANIPQFTLSGFQIINGFSGGDGVRTSSVPDVVIEYNDISVGDDAVDMRFNGAQPNKFLIAYNNLHDSSTGIFVNDPGNNTLVGTAIGNNISNNSWAGFEADLEDEDGEFTFNFMGNTFAGNGDGILLDVEDTDDVRQSVWLNAFNNTFSDNDVGVFIDITDGDIDDADQNFYVTLVGNTFMSQNSDDIRWAVGTDDNSGNQLFSLVVKNNTFSGTGDDAIDIFVDDTYDGADTDLTWLVEVTGNAFMNVGGDAFHVDLTDSDDGFDNFTATITFSNNTVSNIGDDAVDINVADIDDGDAFIFINNNNITNVSGDGVRVYLSDTDVSSLSFGGNFIDGVSGDGFYFDGYDTDISSPLGNNLISNIGGNIFDISDVNGQVLINGALAP